MNKLLKRLQRLDLGYLEKLAGETIVRAVQSAYDTNREKALAKLVIDRFGSDIFKEKQIRKSLIQSLDSKEAIALSELWGKKFKDEFKAYEFLEDYFTKSFNRVKVEAFIDFVGISRDFLPQLIEDERSTNEYVEAGYGEVLISKGVLHPYQRQIKDISIELINNGTRKFIIQMPTGAGKTVTSLEIIVDKLRNFNGEGIVVWIVDSTELAEQTLQAFKALWKLRGDRGINLYRYFGKFTPDFSSAGGVVFASFVKANEALTSKNDDVKNNFKALCKNAALLVVDEAHTSVAETFDSVIRNIISRDAPLIGLTATPGRPDPVETKELTRMYGGKLVSIKSSFSKKPDEPRAIIDYLVQEGYLAEIHYEELESGVSVEGGDEDIICKKLAENSVRNMQIVMQIEREVKNKESTIVFSCTRDHVFALVALCRARALDVDFIVGETTQSKRIEILNKFKKRELMVLINHEILSTGVDVPNINKLILTRPVGSAILYSQMIGRALRGPKNGGNPVNTIVNIRDNLSQFPTAAFVYESFTNNFKI